MSSPAYSLRVGTHTHRFLDLKDVLAQARVAAQMALAELPLRTFLHDVVIPYEEDEVTRLIIDTHDAQAFAPVSHLTVGDFRNWLLADDTDAPEMAAAVSKLMQSCILPHVTNTRAAASVIPYS